MPEPAVEQYELRDSAAFADDVEDELKGLESRRRCTCCAEFGIFEILLVIACIFIGMVAEQQRVLFFEKAVADNTKLTEFFPSSLSARLVLSNHTRADLGRLPPFQLEIHGDCESRGHILHNWVGGMWVDAEDIPVHGLTHGADQLSLWRNIGGVWSLYIDPDETSKSPLLYGVRERFQVTLINQLDEPTLIHWHGLTPPNYLDGVPWISSLPIQPNETVFYDFSLYDRGFYWMHSHFGHHLEEGLFAPIIIEDSMERRAQLGLETHTLERNILFVVVDRHWRTQCAYNYELAPHHCPIGGFDSWNNYSFSANFKSIAEPYVREVKPGWLYRVRILMAGSMATWQVHMPPELDAEFIATDGKDVEPGVKFNDALVTVGGQRWDVLIRIPPDKEAWYAIRAVRRPNAPLKEDVTEQVAILLKTPHAEATDQPLLQPRVSEKVRPSYTFERQFHALDALIDPHKKPDVHHIVRLTGIYDGSSGRMQPVFHINGQVILLWPATVWCLEGVSCRRVEGDNGFSYKDFCVGEERTTNVRCDQFACPPGEDGNSDGRCLAKMVEHDAWEGVHVDDCHLWTIRMSAYKPNKGALKVCEGDRVWISYVNEGDEHHPMHLHGTHQQVININGEAVHGTMRDTVYVAPWENITVAFNAFNPGQWALHCHIAHHTSSGMVTTVEYDTTGRCEQKLYHPSNSTERYKGNRDLEPHNWPKGWLDVLNT